MDNKSEDFYEYKKKVCGPDSWFYNFLDKSIWEDFKKDCDRFENENDRNRYIYFLENREKQKLNSEYQKRMQRANWSDKKDLQELADLYTNKITNVESIDEYNDLVIEYLNIVRKYEKWQNIPKLPDFDEKCRKKSKKADGCRNDSS